MACPYVADYIVIPSVARNLALIPSSTKQGEIPLRRLTDRNDSEGLGMTTLAFQTRFVASLSQRVRLRLSPVWAKVKHKQGRTRQATNAGIGK
jgi:hypothetical protein